MKLKGYFQEAFRNFGSSLNNDYIFSELKMAMGNVLRTAVTKVCIF